MKTILPIRPACWASLLILLLGLAGCGSTPQLGGNEESLRAAEALWTAVTSRRQPLVEQSADEIERQHTAGALSDDAYDALVEVVAAARASDWDDATDDLKGFLKGQRRQQP